MPFLRRFLLAFPLLGSFQMAVAQDLYVDGNIIGLGYHADSDAPGYTTSYTDGDDDLETLSAVDFGIASSWGTWTWWQGANSSLWGPVKQMELDLNNVFSIYNRDSVNNFPAFTFYPNGLSRRITAYHGEGQATGYVSFTRILPGTTSTAVGLGPGTGGTGELIVRSNNGGPAKVGIGVSDPAERLDVAGNIKLTGNIVTASGALSLPTAGTLLATTGSGSATRLVVGGTTSLSTTFWGGSTVIGADGQNKVVAGYLAASVSGAVIGSHNSALNAWADLNVAGQNLIFRTAGESERMRIDSSGNVGIGTTAPAAKLDVNGTVQIAGDVKMKNNAVIRISPAGDVPMDGFTTTPSGVSFP